MRTLYLLLSVIGTTLAGEMEKEVVLSRRGYFVLSSDFGITVFGRTSLLFEVKSCGDAVIALSDIVSITRSSGRYFMIFLDRKKTNAFIRDSCFKCKPKKTIKKTVLDCNEYRPLWISWDNMGGVRIGQGVKVGDELLLEYTSSNPFPARHLQLTSLNPPARIRFPLQDEAPISYHTLHHVPVTVTVKEDVAVDSVVYLFDVTPDTKLFMVTRNTPFQIRGTKVHTTARLDFETENIYELKFQSNKKKGTTIMTVLVEDVNDEKPEVMVGDVVRIPEELPVGFVIGGIFAAKDRDTQDNLKYRLEGEDSYLLSVVGDGQLRIERRIDHDGHHGRRVLDKLTLHVEDSAHHETTINLNISITDINDNVPTCTPGLLSRTIQPNERRGGQLIVNISCSDEDSNGNGQVRLQIVPSSDGTNTWKMFLLAGFELFTNIDDLRQEYAKREITAFALTVLAVDKPQDGRANTGNAVVVVELAHLTSQRVNDYPPKWTAPLLDIEGNFPRFVIPEHVVPGTVIGRFFAQDKDQDSYVAYHILSITDDAGNKNTGPFLVDMKTGDLRTTGMMDADQETGGVKFYKILILATDGEHIISGSVMVIVRDTNDNPPHFNKTVYTVSFKNKKLNAAIVHFDVQDYDKNSVTLSLARHDLRFFRLTSEASNKWSLKFRDGVDPKKDATIPPVIVVTAHDDGNPPRTSQAVVILKDLAPSIVG